MSYYILCIDGGGVRGVYAATLLKRLTALHPPLLSQVNLLAGTSSGAFIALALAAGHSLDNLLEFFSTKTARQIFQPRQFKLWRPRYRQEPLRQVLSQLFPEDLRLQDLKHQVVIPAFQVARMRAASWQPIFYHNFVGSPYLNFRVLDVALASSAAPSYFPAYQGHIDGGVIANNPSLIALSLAVDSNGGARQLQELTLLSLGTGLGPHRLPEHTENWGILQWMLVLNRGCQLEFPLLTVLTEGDVEADAHLAESLLSSRYWRLNPLLPRPISLDAWQEIPRLQRWAELVNLEDTHNWLLKYW